MIGPPQGGVAVRVLVGTCLVLTVLCAGPLSGAPVVPPPPESITTTMRNTLTHGLRLLAAGDFAFARGHFRSVRPPRPLRVHINALGAPAKHRQSAGDAAREALAAWCEAAPDLVGFDMTDREELAEVVICFEYDVAQRTGSAARYVCGIAHSRAVHHGKGIKRSALIRVAIYGEGVGRPPHSPASLRHVVGHEFGHFLGLGESDDKADIMGPDAHGGTPSTRPSSADVARLRELIALGDQLAALAERQQKVPFPATWQKANEGE
jgi:hypothetical protein